MLKEGIKGTQTVEVVYENTATAVGSGVLKVFATPCMIAILESGCANCRAVSMIAGVAASQEKFLKKTAMLLILITYDNS